MPAIAGRDYRVFARPTGYSPRAHKAIMELVSACLVGIKCRYDARDRSDPELALRFKRGELMPFCPELLGGLGLPRASAEIKGGAGAEVLDGRARVADRDGHDVTAAFIAGAEACLALARACDADEAFLAANSPSCGVGEVYDGSFSGRRTQGDGVAAALLRRNGIRLIRVAKAETPRGASVSSKGAGLKIRPVASGDCARLAELAGQLGYPCEEEEVRRRIPRYLNGGNCTILVAELEGEAVGWTSLEIVDHFYLERFVEISGFVVDEKCRGAGIGRLLMGAAEAWAAERGAPIIRLKTNTVRKEAHLFYEALGFERVKEQYTYSKRLRD